MASAKKRRLRRRMGNRGKRFKTRNRRVYHKKGSYVGARENMNNSALNDKTGFMDKSVINKGLPKFSFLKM